MDVGASMTVCRRLEIVSDLPSTTQILFNRREFTDVYLNEESTY